MGSNNDWRFFEAPNQEAALKVARQILEQSRYEDGNSYSGCIGMADGIRVHATPKALTEKQAHDLLWGKFKTVTNDWGQTYGEQVTEGLAKKWGPAILVRVRNKGSRKARWMLGAECAS